MKEGDDFKKLSCRLVTDDKLLIIPSGKGEPPSWYPAFGGYTGVYVDREIFDQLKKRKYNKPCDICPVEDCTSREVAQ